MCWELKRLFESIVLFVVSFPYQPTRPGPDEMHSIAQPDLNRTEKVGVLNGLPLHHVRRRSQVDGAQVPSQPEPALLCQRHLAQPPQGADF